MDKEFYLLKEYLDIIIQILPECKSCGGMKIHKPQLPTFEYFKEYYNDKRYSLSLPNYKESKCFNKENNIAKVHTHGLGTKDGIGYRFYNMFMGCKFFTGGNIQGDYTINSSEVNLALKNNE